MIIVGHLATTTIETGRAAQLCDAAAFGGKNDWFLPSIGELSVLYGVREAAGIGNSGVYRSSSQNNNLNAWAWDFSDNRLSNNSKTNTQPVRAIRAF